LKIKLPLSKYSAMCPWQRHGCMLPLSEKYYLADWGLTVRDVA